MRSSSLCWHGVEARSEWAVLGSLVLRFLAGDLFINHVAVSKANLLDLSCSNLYLQLCRGLPGDGENTRPSAAVAVVLAAHPYLRARLKAVPRYGSNMVDTVGKQLETVFTDMLTLLFAGRLKKSVSVAVTKVLVGTQEYQRRFELSYSAMGCCQGPPPPHPGPGAGAVLQEVRLEEDMPKVSMERHGHAKQLVVCFGAASIGTRGGWGADAVLRACCKVVCRSRGAGQRRCRVVLVDEHRTTRVSSAVNGKQPCEEDLDHEQPTKPADWKPPAGQVEQRLVRPAWSQQPDQPVRGLMWCPVVAHRKPPQAPGSSQSATPAAASEPGPSTPPPAKRNKRTKAEPPAEPSQPGKGKGKAQGMAAKAKPAPQPGRWLDRDCNAALNMQRIGESRWRPLELCCWPEQGALPAKGKEYTGLGYKRLRDKPPKAQEQQPAVAHLQAPAPGPAEQGNSPSASQGASQSAGPQGSLDKSNHGKPSVRASTDKQPSQLPATLSGSGAGQNGQSTVQGASTPPTNSSGVGSNLKALSPMEANNVQDTLLRVSALIQKFAEGRSERTTPIQGLKRALDLLITDAQAQFASVQLIRDTMDCALLVALIGAPDIYLESNRLQRLGGTGTAADVVASSSCAYLHWNDADLSQPPIDWQQLSVHAGLQQLSAVPIKASDKVLGILTLGFKDKSDHRGANSMWSTYMQLVAASITSLVKDGSMAKYQALVKDLHDTADIDTLVHKVVVHMRSVLGHTSNHQVWYRVALTATNNMAATIFDDLMQVPASLMQRGLSNQSTNSSFKMLKEVQAQAGVMRTTVAMKSTVMKISVHNRQQVMIPDVQKLINQSGNVSIDIFNTRLIKPPTSVLVFPLKVKQHIFGVIFCMSSVQTDFNDVSPRLREVCEVMSPHLLLLLNNTLLKDYKVVQNAQPVSSEGGSVSGSRNQSFSGRSINDSGGVNMSAESFVFAQSRSSTGALVTGLTEKLNQKRIKSSMDFAGNAHLGDLQVTNCLGEGGFAKVFRGLWRGLVVVCDDGKNEKMVMKNAHEIAILGALSHPNIVQAYTCMTDVLVAELLSQCLRHASPALLSSSALKYLAGMEERTCHIEVIELCDLGNMSTALKNSVFQVAQPDKMLAQVLAANGGVEPTAGGPEGNREGRLPLGAKVHMRTLLLTLIEIASAMGYLHRMGVVHCDLKPANVLLKSSNMDSRGFTTKVSDFGLSRVEDDDNNSSFPFNSCGTAAYVAPEALICNKKVNSSVDVYAFGILMWEMYTGQRPYGNLKQQQLVEEVVMRGLRPKFPFDAPQPYVALSQACWSGSAHARPTFDEVLTTLNSMLNTLNPPDGSLYYPAAAHQQAPLQQPMQYEASNVAAMDAAPANGTPTGYRGSYPQVQ
ncbi:hypothetical protein QJQ45_017942 [Haematococcus lacustris]|nr:hypothetical protein QJQ45_017942 [Haematococcus lacustris]